MTTETPGFVLLDPAGPTRVYWNTKADTYSVADDSGWYPGIYATQDAALYAPTVEIELLGKRTHWSARGRGDRYRPVTLDELRAWAAEAQQT